MPARPDQHEVQILIRQIDQCVINFVNSHLVPYEMTGPQGRLLGYLYEQEVAGISVRQVDLEEKLGLTGSSITSLLQGLEAKGFILRRMSAADNRAKELFVTEKGHGLIAEFEHVFHSAEERLLSGFSPEERGFFIALLRKALRNIE
jgi:MarR family transcriptional regulator, repressor for mepA